MSNFFLSTGAMSGSARAAVLAGQRDLAMMQKEIATGKKADVGLEIGYRSSDLVYSQQVIDLAAAIKGDNEIVSSRLRATQTALETLGKLGADLLDCALASVASSTAASQIEAGAKILFKTFSSVMNVEVGGVYVFGGLNVGEEPLFDYFAASGSLARDSFQAAFQSAFGFSASDRAVSDISPDEMTAFIATELDSIFEDTSWSANWSKSSPRVPAARIAFDELQEAGTSANEAAFRQLAKALVITSELGGKDLSEQTRSVMMEKVAELVGNATSGLVGIRSRLGIVEERIASANERLSLQSTILSNRIAEVESIDPFTTSTGLNELMQRLEASYATTVRIQQLSVLNFL